GARPGGNGPSDNRVTAILAARVERMLAPVMIPHFIGGQRIGSVAARSLPVYNPATGEETGKLPLATPQDVDAAVQAAKAAFPSWAQTPPLKRARVMFRFRELLEANQEALAAQITAEHGKTHSDALGEVARGIEIVEF